MGKTVHRMGGQGQYTHLTDGLEGARGCLTLTGY